MTWQWNPERGDITDPDEEEQEAGCYMMTFNTPDGLCSPFTECPGCAQKRTRAYYGGALIAETVRSTHGPLLTAAPDMLALLKEYVADDPCAFGDPRHTRAIELIAKITGEKPTRLFGPCDPTNGVSYNHDDCSFFNDLTGETCNCACHTPADITAKVNRLRERGIILSPELEGR
jgi:hypothetical protein